MTYHVFLSTASVAAILVLVAILATLSTLGIEVLGQSERHYTGALFACLGVIWAGAIVVIVLING